MEKKNKFEARVYLEVDTDTIAKRSAYSGWSLIAQIAGKTEKILTEGTLVRPDISFCLVAQYLNNPDKEDKNKKVEVNFAGTIRSIPLSAIKRVILRP